MERWCEHLKYDNCYGVFYPLNQSHVIDSVKTWNFCPICGTPRPKEKTLEEKFNDEMASRGTTITEYGKGIMRPLSSVLAQIAKDHYEKERG